MAEALTKKGLSTRERILLEARKLLVAQGYDGFVLREVAVACGIKLGNLQYYFPTADDLLLAVIAAEGETDREAVARAMASDDVPEAMLQGLIDELVSRWRGDGAPVYTVLILLAQHKLAFRQLYEQIYENYYAALEAAVARCVPEVSKAELSTRVRLVSALIDGVAYQTGVGSSRTFTARIAAQAAAIATAPVPKS